ncbi:transporter suffix domain-containing protein [Bacillus pinisoli]|uniref:transporter suffix domain-containing protein n=1 Tax=Bacillus pinisoli TaxID=2901866 RepID=UPI001FF15E2F|nr:transporter suffix domain-containing protein [Bacillus pinisoli]
MQNESTVKKPFIYKIGMFLIISSFIIWVFPVGIPFLPISGKMKAISITSSLIIAEVFFWVGALMVGKEVARKIRNSLNPRNWRKKSTDQQDGAGDA